MPYTEPHRAGGERWVTARLIDRIPAYRWSVIIGLYSGISSAAFLVSYSVGVMLPEMRDDLAMGPVEAGVLGSATWVATILLGVPVATLVSRYNPRTVIFLSGLYMALFAALQGWAPTYELELAFRFAFMAGFVSRSANLAMLAQRWFRTDEIPRMQMVIMVINGAAQIAALSAIPWFLIWLGGWRNTLYAVGALLTVASLVWVALTRDRPMGEAADVSEGDEGGSVAGAFSHQPIWVFGISGAFCVIGTSAFEIFWPTFLVDVRGFSLQTAGLFAAAIPVGQIAGALCSQFVRARVRQRWHQMYLTGVVCSGSMLTMSLIPFAPVLPLGAFGLGWACMQATPTIMAIPYELP
ncbi:MAG: MFS transporter, partial [Dehalococcoidia bacterium]